MREATELLPKAHREDVSVGTPYLELPDESRPEGHPRRTPVYPMTPGTLMIFEGRHSLHRVSPVEGDVPRTVGLLAYDTKPGTEAGGLVETAWATALATPRPGHVPFLAVLDRHPRGPARDVRDGAPLRPGRGLRGRLVAGDVAGAARLFP